MFQYDPKPLLLKIGEVQRLLRVGRSTVYKLLAEDPDFPRPVHVTSKSVAWRREDLEKWVQSRPEVEVHAAKARTVRAASVPEATAA